MALLLVGCREQHAAQTIDLGVCSGSIPMPCATSCELPVCPSVPPTYAQVSPIIQQHCTVCHTAGGSEAVMPFDTLAQIEKRWGPMLDQIYACNMPRQGDTVDEMSPDDRVLLESWFVCGPPDAGSEISDGGASN